VSVRAKFFDVELVASAAGVGVDEETDLAVGVHVFDRVRSVLRVAT
jgi:hypothetical protein